MKFINFKLQSKEHEEKQSFFATNMQFNINWQSFCVRNVVIQQI